MRLLIFGSTGSIGRELVKQALEQGHTVTAFARDPAKLDIKHANLQVVQGDVMDLASVEKAVQGQEAVLCSIGAGRKGTIRSEGTRHIIRAMEKADVADFMLKQLTDDTYLHKTPGVSY
jgi:putative NADH-flavin reductase